MNIQKYQIKKIENSALNTILKSGINPTSIEIKNKINSLINQKTLGLPLFSPIYIDKGSKSNKNAINTSFSEIKNDLDTLFYVLRSQLQESAMLQNRQDDFLERVDNKIDSLMETIKIVESYSKDKQVAVKNIDFSDMRSINTIESLQNNLIATTSEIDYSTPMIRNEIYSKPNSKIDLYGSRISVSSSDPIKKSVYLKNMIADSLSKTSTFEFANNIEKRNKQLDIRIDLASSVDVSRVTLNGHFLNGYTISISISEDGNNFLEKSNKIAKINNFFSFNKAKVKSILISLKKSKDFIEKDDYIIVIKNIAIYNDVYSKHSSLTTNPIKINCSSSSVTVIPTQDVPSGASIIYFIGIEDKNGVLTWNKCEGNKKISLGLLKEEKKITSPLEVNFGEKITNNTNNKSNPTYKISSIKNHLNKNSISVNTGYSQWLIEKLDNKIIDMKNPKINIQDYKKENVTAIAPLSASFVELRFHDSDNYIILTQNIYCESDLYIKDRFIQFEVEEEYFEEIVLINGKQLKSKDDLYSFKLHKGHNEIKIIILLCKHISYSNSKLVKHNFNLLSSDVKIFSSKPSKLIDYKLLSKSISDRVLDVYSFVKDNGEDFIVVKYNPFMPQNPDFDEIKMTKDEYFKTFISYKYTPEDVVQSLCSDNENLNLRVMARLNTSDTSVTPSIQYLKVVSE